MWIWFPNCQVTDPSGHPWHFLPFNPENYSWESLSQYYHGNVLMPLFVEYVLVDSNPNSVLLLVVFENPSIFLAAEAVAIRQFSTTRHRKAHDFVSVAL